MKQNSLKGTIAYCAVTMGFSMLSTAFGFYYVKVFLDLYHIQESWFHFTQILYMVWNAVNDPLFAVLQDNTNFLLTRTRREGILYTAPLFAITFVIPWIKFGESSWAVGVHLIISLFLYDTMYTFIGLLVCCLFTELSTDNHERLKLTRYSQIASLIGAQSVMFLEYASNSLENFFAFQQASVVVAVSACLLMMYAGFHGHTQYESESKTSEICDATKEKDQKEIAEDSFYRKVLQLFMERNFLAFIVTNFFQEFHRAFWGGFLAIFCEYLVTTDQVSVAVRSFFYGMSGTFGGILVIIGTPVIGRLGYFCVIRYSFIWKIVSGLTMYFLIGFSNAWVIMLFILLDRSFANGTFSLFNMPLSDIADDDKEKYNRRQPISSTVYGSNALVVKPSQSLSPMLVVFILNHYGYEHLKEHKEFVTVQEVESMKEVMFQLICFFPVVLGFIQFIAWSQYAIRRSIVKQSVNPGSD